MTAFLIQVIDPVAWLLAIAGSLGFIAMALLWAIEGAGRANDAIRHSEALADRDADIDERDAEIARLVAYVTQLEGARRAERIPTGPRCN